MKQRLYIFSDSVLKRKANTLFVETVVRENEDAEEGFWENDKEDYLIGKEEIIPSGDKKYIPVENIDSITSIGSVRFNSRFLYFLSQNSIPLHVVNYRGDYSGSFIPSERQFSGSVLLKQSAAYKNFELRLAIAKEMIDASVHNMIANLKYHNNRGCELSDVIEYMEEYRNDIRTCDTVDELRGIEGIIRRAYYESWRNIFNYPVNFYKRIKNPSPDIINSLISYGNAIVYGLCLNEIFQSRLYPEIGFVHEPGDGKLSLVYDIADIFKPLLTDRIIFKVINKNILSEQDAFVRNGVCYIKKEAKKKYAQEFETKMHTKFKMDGKNKKVTYKRVVREECYKLISFLDEKAEYNAYKTRW